MKIVSLIARLRAEHFEAFRHYLAAVPGAQCQAEEPERGLMILTVEDGEGYAVSDSLVAIGVAPNLMGVTLAYDYSDEALDA